MITLLLGIFLAALLFSAVLWSAYRAYMTTGRLRAINLATALLTIGLMAMITYQAHLPGRVIGAALVISAFAATYRETGSARLLPLTLAAFGTVAAMGVPFA